MAWLLTAVGWFLSPTISLLGNKFLEYLVSDTSRMLQKLKFRIVPDLKFELENLEEQRMLRSAKNEDHRRSESDFKRLSELTKHLKSALYEAEDILDLVDYHRKQKRRTRGRKSHGSSRVHRLFNACITTLRASLVPRLESFNSWVRRLFRCCITRCRDSRFRQRIDTLRAALLRWMPSSSNCIICRPCGQLLPLFITCSNPEVGMLRTWSWHSVNIITSYCRSKLAWSANSIVGLRSATREWSYEQLGNLQRTSSSTTKDADKKSHSSIVKDTEKESHTSNVKDTNKKSRRRAAKGTVKESRNRITKESCNSTGTDTYKDPEKKVFGRDGIRRRICRLLREEPDSNAASSSNNKRPYSVIGIHGIAGSGKSTLAQYVCDFEKDEGNHFDLIMFCHLSKKFSLDDIFCNLLKAIRKDDSKDTGSAEEELKEKLKGKCFLLVLDDLCINDEALHGWKSLCEVLDAGKSGSRILVTAQREDAVHALGFQAKNQIPIPDLDAENYLELFMHHALQGAPDVDGIYTNIGAKIVEKLHRSPIAAVVVAKRLRNKSIDIWDATEKLNVLNETMGALWWSYQQLDPDIRQCFAYCSTFPRGYKFERDELVLMWIAQGFVKTSMETEDDLGALGQGYFDQLLQFSFLQAQRKGLFGPETFIIQDLLHKLSERVAVWDYLRIDVKSRPQDIRPEVRHLFIETNNRAEIAQKILELENLRTLIIVEKHVSNEATTAATTGKHNEKHDLIKEKIFESMFRRLRKLRVLKVEVKYENKIVFTLPDSIGEMKHLRYLNFRSLSNLELIFPGTFSKLYHMQIIDAYKLTFPCADDMADGLMDLWHCSSHLDIPNIGKLTSLQTMPCFTVRGQEKEGYELKQLEDLNNIRGTLTIDGLGLVRSKKEALEANLDQKTRLTNLTLDFGEKHICSPGVEAEVLDGLSPTKDLTELTIRNYSGLRYPSWMLGPEHPGVPKQLVLDRCARLAIPRDSGFFKGLVSLDITNSKSDSLPDNMEHLESLQNLKICFWDKIELLPPLPKSLDRLLILSCHALSKTCQDERHENWEKVQQVRRVEII
ncbi:unnamed protein product [Urochloa decumbens]|uniref:Uncharacterized protein n=1 Tax=Urochloa decumbens TaxID=240449 RepID=A0ABC9B6C0_9POAL